MIPPPAPAPPAGGASMNTLTGDWLHRLREFIVTAAHTDRAGSRRGAQVVG